VGDTKQEAEVRFDLSGIHRRPLESSDGTDVGTTADLASRIRAAEPGCP